MTQYDVAIVGGGIVGLAHAWSAAKRNLSVAVFERDHRATGASVRNFGMIWPIGQTAGNLYETALRSRELWLELHSQQVVEVESCGSLHLAHQTDETELLQEFIGQGTHQAEWLTPQSVQTKTGIANPNGLQGGMYSPTELRVDPRTASSRIATWLNEKLGVEFYFNTTITQIHGKQLGTSDGQEFLAEKILICSGSDLRTLFPKQFAQSGLKLCKLQMLRTVPQATVSSQANAHIASGLTLRHYSSFEKCQALPVLKERIHHENPKLDRFGIHVMASQFPSGEIVLGDSHEYDDQITPFDKTEIDELMLEELRKVIRLDDWTISEKWHGIYAKHPSRPVYETAIDEQVSLFVGTGGAGMTLSFGLAEQYWNSVS